MKKIAYFLTCLFLAITCAFFPAPLTAVASGSAEVVAGGSAITSWLYYSKYLMFSVPYDCGAERGDYTLVDGRVKLLREGKSYVLTSECGLKVMNKPTVADGEDTSALRIDVRLDASCFSTVLGTEYERKAGDRIVIHGSFKHESLELKLTFLPFQITVDSDDNGEPKKLTVSEVPIEETQLDFKMVEGASIRLEEGLHGIRFMAELGADYDETASYRVMIVPEAHLTKWGITSNYYAEYVKVYDTIADMETKPFRCTAELAARYGGAMKEGYWYVCGSLTNLKLSNYAVDFFGIAYKINGKGEYEYAEFFEGDNVRSLAGVAQRALDSSENYDEDQLTILQAYASYVK